MLFGAYKVECSLQTISIQEVAVLKVNSDSRVTHLLRVPFPPTSSQFSFTTTQMLIYNNLPAVIAWTNSLDSNQPDTLTDQTKPVNAILHFSIPKVDGARVGRPGIPRSAEPRVATFPLIFAQRCHRHLSKKSDKQQDCRLISKRYTFTKTGRADSEMSSDPEC